MGGAWTEIKSEHDKHHFQIHSNQDRHQTRSDLVNNQQHGQWKRRRKQTKMDGSNQRFDEMVMMIMLIKRRPNAETQATDVLTGSEPNGCSVKHLTAWMAAKSRPACSNEAKSIFPFRTACCTERRWMIVSNLIVYASEHEHMGDICSSSVAFGVLLWTAMM